MTKRRKELRGEGKGQTVRNIVKKLGAGRGRRTRRRTRTRALDRREVGLGDILAFDARSMRRVLPTLACLTKLSGLLTHVFGQTFSACQSRAIIVLSGVPALSLAGFATRPVSEHPGRGASESS